jgi:PAS domain S-box-containing protein
MKILLLEDDPNDVELIESVLRQEGFGDQITLATSLHQFQSLLDRGGFDVVLSDYRLPVGSGLDAIRLVRERDPDVPMIVVSGSLGEEQAIETLQHGATDYVLKQRLSRLGPALRRALAEHEERRLRRRAEEQRDRFYSLSIDLFCIAGRDMRLHDVNPACEVTLGWSRDELLAAQAGDVVHPEDLARVAKAAKEIGVGELARNFEIRVRTKGGEWRWFQWAFTADGRDQRVYAVGRDITELKRAQDELADRARRQALLAELGREALRETDLDSLFDRAARLVADGCAADFVGMFELDLDGRSLSLRNGTGWALGHVGRERVASGRASQEGFALETGAPAIVSSWSDERRFPSSALIGAHAIQAGIVVAIPGRDAPFGALGAYSRTRREFSLDDISFLQSVAQVLAEAVERRRYEDALRSTEDQLRHSQRMEALGLLAAGVAHDFNNVLTAILGYTDLASEEDLEVALRKHYLDEVRAAADRAVDLSRQLLAFSRKQVRAPRVLDLSSIARELEPMLHRVIGEDVDLRFELASAPLLVEADPSQLEQVLINLAVNARDAMPQGGELVIETSEAEPDASRPTLGDIGAGRKHFRLAVRDTGSGMDEATLRQAFEPFFTTKPEGRGTGLGLSIVQKVVKQNGGAIQVETAPGRGTTIRVFLPEAVRAPLPSEGHAARELRDGHGESVLVLDDDQPLRGIIVQVLSKHGYNVTEAADIDEARQFATKRSRPFDLLLSDLVLRRGTGPELSSTLASLGRVRHTLLMSGFMSHPIAERWLSEPGEIFLPKPFSQEQLLRAVREALDR